MFRESGFRVYRAEGKKIKYFRKSKGSAKTDKLDARYLSEYGDLESILLKLYSRDNESTSLENIKKIKTRIIDLKLTLEQEKNRLQAPAAPKLVLQTIEKSIKFLNRMILTLEKELMDIIDEDITNLRRKYDILLGEKGIGEVTATTLLAFLPELGKLSRNRIVALADSHCYG
jgi:transposase